MNSWVSMKILMRMRRSGSVLLVRTELRYLPFLRYAGIEAKDHFLSQPSNLTNLSE